VCHDLLDLGSGKYHDAVVLQVYVLAFRELHNFLHDPSRCASRDFLTLAPRRRPTREVNLQHEVTSLFVKRAVRVLYTLHIFSLPHRAAILLSDAINHSFTSIPRILSSHQYIRPSRSLYCYPISFLLLAWLPLFASQLS
jgi:hypothetical protein